MKILVLNAGSSSEKSSLYNIGDAVPPDPPDPLWDAEIEWTDDGAEDKLTVRTSDGLETTETRQPGSRPDGIAQMLGTMWEGRHAVIDGLAEIDVVGHRVVHGGREFTESVRVTPEVKAAIGQLSALAPAHNPANLEGIETVEELLGGVPQVAVFDTAFHSHLPDEAAIYPIPWEYSEKGIRRYGFHGISHQYCAHRAAHLLGRDLTSLRIITCHLGNGCSLAAIREGRSVDTTMGFTPMEGLMMGSRSGSVDPGVLLNLMREKGLTSDELDHILNQSSGLFGVSGVSSDMREVIAAADGGDVRAKLAIDMFVHSLRRHIGAMLASLDGLDALVFTGGIGEHATVIRARACETFRFQGIELDVQENESSPIDGDISATDSEARVLVIQSRENWAIACECRQIVQTAQD